MRRADGGAIDGALRLELVRTLGAADRANNAVLQEHDGRWSVRGDPTEGALIVAARKAGLEDEALAARFARVGGGALLLRAQADEHDPQRCRDDRSVCSSLTKGAPDVLLVRCSHELVGEEARPLTAERRAEILASNEELAGEALRTLGVAFRSLPKDAAECGAFDETSSRTWSSSVSSG